MKTVKNEENKIIFLDEGEEITVRTMFNNYSEIVISCKNHILYIDEVERKRLSEIKLEEEELKKLKKYNEENR